MVVVGHGSYNRVDVTSVYDFTNNEYLNISSVDTTQHITICIGKANVFQSHRRCN